jgi:hypothetical protein
MFATNPAHRVPHGPDFCTKHVEHFRLFSRSILKAFPLGCLSGHEDDRTPTPAPKNLSVHRGISFRNFLLSPFFRSGIGSMFPFLPVIIFWFPI